ATRGWTAWERSHRRQLLTAARPPSRSISSFDRTRSHQNSPSPSRDAGGQLPGPLRAVPLRGQPALPPGLGLQADRAAVVLVAVDLRQTLPALASGEHAARTLGRVVPEAVRVEQAERGPGPGPLAGADREAGGDLEELQGVAHLGEHAVDARLEEAAERSLELVVDAAAEREPVVRRVVGILVHPVLRGAELADEVDAGVPVVELHLLLHDGAPQEVVLGVLDLGADEVR